ncbi:MAG: HAMP domain-containing protein [Desulfobacteraceae bacterium]|nr:MAG: HAMP domain-containing protein [Desulfobacteraceae bacterium]
MEVIETRQRAGGAIIAVVCILAGCCYGFANLLSGKYYLPGCSFAELRPQVALPMFIGILYGPWAGFLCGGLGDMLGYGFSGKGLLFAPYWSLANGFMGFVPGLIRYWGARVVTSISSFCKLLALLLAASSLPFTLSIGVEIWKGGVTFHDALFQLFLPIFITDTIWAFLLVPVFIRGAGLLQIRIELRTILTVHYLLILSVLAAWLSNVIITMQNELRIEELYILGAVTLFVLVFGLVVSAFFAKRITAPVILLTDVAEQAAGGSYANVSLLEKIVSRPDEMGTLATVFRNMIRAVEQRETDLRRQVSELRIEIDRKKQKTDLKKITGTDYFKQLKQKAGDLRRSVSEQEQVYNVRRKANRIDSE